MTSENMIPESRAVELMQQAAFQGAADAIWLMTASRAPVHLDMFTTDTTDMLKGENSMSRKYRVPVRVGYDQEGKEITQWVSGSTRQEVYEKAAQALFDHGRFSNDMPSVKDETPEFMDYAWSWYEIYHKTKVKPNTAMNTGVLIRKHFTPAFGGKSIASITTAAIQQFFNERTELSHSTCQKLLIYLSQIFDSAVEDGLIAKNPAKSKRISFSNKKKERKPLPGQDAADVIRRMDQLQEQERLFVGLAMFTGLRRGELLGLQWSDFHYDAGFLHVERAITFQGNRPVIGLPKSAKGIRMIPMSLELVELVTPFKDRKGFVFAREGDEPFTESTYKRMMERINRTIDLHGATAHVFRHTFLTTAAESGMDVKTLQAIAGHADVATTMDVYVHARKERLRKEGNKLSGMYETVS